MLANKMTDKKIAQLGNKFLVQPKLNGLRGWVDWSNEALLPNLISSGGLKLQFFEHIQLELLELYKLLPYEHKWDGEIYEHGMAMEDIHSIARRTVNRKDGKLSFHIFDCKSPEIQTGRMVHVLSLQRIIDEYNFNYIKVVPTYIATKETWEAYLNSFLDEGYEGIIFRHLAGVYHERKCNDLLKYKATEKKPYRILAVYQGEGWCYDRAGSILVTDDYGRQFAVGSGRVLTKPGRLEVWERRHELVGKTLIVRHEKEVTKTNTGKPRGCNAWEIAV